MASPSLGLSDRSQPDRSIDAWSAFVDRLQRRLSAHVIAYATLLTVITAIIPLDASFGGDDGAYGGAAHALETGGWALERPLPVVDGENEGLLNASVTPRGPLPYTANPGYVVLLRWVAELVTAPAARAGDRAIGYQLVPVLGALMSAAVAWGLTRTATRSATDRAWAPALAFWLVALGPVLVNSTTLWAHTLSTALAGASLWCLALLVDRAPGGDVWHLSPIPALGLTATLVGIAAVRSESVFWIIAVGITATVVVRRRAVVLGVWTAAAGGLVAWMLNRSWGAALRVDRLPIDTAVASSENTGAWLAGRLPAAWRLLLTSLGGGIGPVLALIGTGLALWAGWSFRRSASGNADDDCSARHRRVGTIGLLASAGCLLTHAVLAPGEAISGTLAAWPIVFVLLVAGSTGGRSTAGGQDHILALPVVLLLLAVLATQYSISGGHQWGGRYLSMAFVPLAAMAAIWGLPFFSDRASRAALLALLLAPAIVGVVASHELHARHQALAHATTEIPADVVITTVVALPRLAWTELPTAYYLADPTSVEPLLRQLAAADVETVNVHGLDEVSVDGIAGYRVTTRTDAIRHLELTGWNARPTRASLRPFPEARGGGP